VNIFVDQFGDRFVERKLKSDTVLHVIMWKDQPEGRIRSARLDQVFLDLDGHEIAEPNRRKGQDRNSNRDLSGKCCLNGGVGKICAGFTHQIRRQTNDALPYTRRQHLPDNRQVLVGQTPCSLARPAHPSRPGRTLRSGGPAFFRRCSLPDDHAARSAIDRTMHAPAAPCVAIVQLPALLR